MSAGNALFIISDLLPVWMDGAEGKVTIFSAPTGLAESMDGWQQLLKGALSAFKEIFWVGMPERKGGNRRWVTFEFSPGVFEEILHTNREFAEAIEQVVGPDDTIWIQGYYLFPLADMIRSRFPEIAIGLMVDIAFPSFGEFRIIPAKRQEEIVLGMLGADLIGFGTKEDSIRFVQCVQLITVIDDCRGTLRYGERLIRISAFASGVAEGMIKDGSDIQGVQDFLDELRIIKMKQEKYRARFFDVQSRDAVLDRYRRAKKRLFLLDYDGTLTPIFNLPSLARPDNLLLDILNNIAQNRKNSVYIISSRDSKTLDKWLGHLPVNIIAEHGARIRYKGKGWEEQGSDMQKREDVDETERVTGREMGYEAGEETWQEIGDGVPAKGAAIRQILSREEQDFILAIGDDRTDEDMFRLLAGNGKACTIKVGKDPSFAQYNLHTPQMVISLLGNMNFLEQQSYK